ncbi:MAG: polysaccharide biosynthesis protein [Vicinamibacterales bacterium]
MSTFTPREEELLLGRPVRPLLSGADRAARAGERCLVTGAGGTIGSELARQIASCRPGLLTLVDHSEEHLFHIEREIAASFPGVPLDPVLADVTRPTAIHLAFRRARPHVVFHAAAYKHVTMAERAACAAVRVNVLGAATVLAAARAGGARFVLVSTDKAAAPLSVMGATKRLAERVTLAAVTPGFRPIVVRFGNVLASSGSFVTIAEDCLRRGVAIPITDPDATRYFMTVSEASSLVMKADAIAHGGETFWLDMGAAVRIGDLVERLLDVARLRGVAPVPIDVIGLRAGEKRAEQLTTQGLALCRTDHPRIWMARQAPLSAELTDAAVQALRRQVARGDGWSVLKTLTMAVPDYEPSLEAQAIARADRMHIQEDARIRRTRVA